MGFIKRKVGFCVDCTHSVAQNIISNRCSYHYKLYRDKVNKEKKKARLSPSDALEKTFGIGKKQSELVLWFAKKMKESEPVCENCGCKINKYNQAEWHGSQGHILPKAHFESVKTHPDNHVVLCRYGNFCHAKFDSSWSTAEKMPVFRIVKERFKLFESLIAPDERRRIPECFYER